MDRFVLIARGATDSSKGVVRLRPNCYENVYELKRRRIDNAGT